MKSCIHTRCQMYRERKISKCLIYSKITECSTRSAFLEKEKSKLSK